MHQLTQSFRFFLPILALATLGCGGLDVLGGGPSTPPGDERRISGEIDRVDADRREIVVDTGAERLTARYDERTRVVYRGEQYPPTALEAGDVVRLELFGRGDDLYAGYVEVTESVQERRGGEPPGRFGGDRTEVAGTIERVDSDRREILVDDRGDRVTVHYDDETRVVYRGQQYRPENLEPGDLVRVETEENDRRELVAREVTVERSVQERAERGETDDLVTGTVRWVDPDRRELEIETERGSRVLLLYEPGLVVRYRGESYEPAALDSGDVVEIEVRRDGGDLYAEAVDVTESAQERRAAGEIDEGEVDPGERPDGPAGATRTLSGTVEWTDERRGELGVRTGGEGVVTIEVPFNAPRADRDRFEDLDRGDRVRLEATEISRGRYELVRFR